MVSRLRSTFVVGILLALVFSLASVGAVIPHARAATASVEVTTDLGTVVVEDAPAPIVLSPSRLPNPQVGVAYSQEISATGGTPPYSYALTGGSLPAGLSFSSGGILSGTPTYGGRFNVSLTATDSNGATATGSYDAWVYGPAIGMAPSVLPPMQVGSLFSATISASGGTAPYTYRMVNSNDGGLGPPGLSISAGGVLSGTPTTAGPYDFTVWVDDSSTGNASDTEFGRIYKGTVAPVPAPVLVLETATVPGGTVGVAYSSTMTAAGGTPPYTYSVFAGPLPAGLALDASTGVISGTPTNAGTSGFGIQVADGAGATAASPIYSVAFAAPFVGVGPFTLPRPQVGAAYSVQLTANGGTAPYSFTSPGLPAGLTLSPAGLLAGTPTTSGRYSIAVTATDSSTGQSAPFSGSRMYSGTIADAPSLTVSPASLPAGTAYVDYQQTLAASGGTAPYTYSLLGDGLPDGMTLTSGGVLAGTPTEAGTFTFSVMAQDSSPAVQLTGAANYILSIAQPAIVLTTPSLPDATAGVGYATQLAASGGAAPYAFAVSSGSLPAGLQLSSDGQISGTTSAHGTSEFTVTATDGNDFTGAKAFTLLTMPVPLSFLPSTLPTPTAGEAYAGQLNASGGISPYTWTLTQGALPDGLSLDGATGAISGTPTAVGSITFTATVDDAGASPFHGTASQEYTLTVPSVPLELSGSLPQAHVGDDYVTALAGAGGTGPYTFALQPGAVLPAGLDLASDGLLTGIPEVAGIFELPLVLTDAYGSASNATGQLIVAPAIGISPTTLPDGTTGTAYEQQLTADGGTAPYTFAVTLGILPTDLELSADGLLSGTPVTHDSASFTVTATDADGFPGVMSYTLSVAPADLVLGPEQLSVPAAGEPYSAQLSTSGGIGPFSYALTSGALPTGLSLDAANGLITGTPTVVGSFDFTVTSTDTATAGPDAVSLSRDYTLVVPSGPLELEGTLPQAHVGDDYVGALAGAGGTGPYTVALQPGAVLPAGLNLASDGLLTGIPEVAGDFELYVILTDVYGSQSNATASLTVAPLVGITPVILPDGKSGAVYEQQLGADGGTAPYTFAVTSGTLPAGLELSADGLLSGTPVSHGSASFTVTATDADGFPGTISYTLSVTPADLVLGPDQLPVPTAGTPYSAQLSMAGGIGPFSYVLSAGALPAGLSLDSATGLISGTPTAVGSFDFTLTTTDDGSMAAGVPDPSGPATFKADPAAAKASLVVLADAASVSKSYTVAVQSAVLGLDGELPDGQVGEGYSTQLAATGGVGPYTYTLSPDAILPRGLALGNNGILSGEPEASGASTFEVIVADSQGSTSTVSAALRIAPAAVAPAPKPLPKPTGTPTPTPTPTGVPSASATPAPTTSASATTTAAVSATATAPASSGAGLARTGANGTTWLLAVGVIAVLGGLATTFLVRRRNKH